ncbi:MAG: hypothetical protein OEN56_11855 [Gemmatimonadota bacterium]|nr:hypothetical protein [Gemmatimonadota bacterium]
MPNNTRRLLGVTFALAAMIATHVGAQETARQRAQRTLPPDVYERLVALGAEMEEIGVPAEPLFNKALEGAAKRVPTDRLLPAVQEHAGRLREARAALGPNAGVPLLVAGADALRRGVPSDALRSLPQDRPRSPVAVLVLAELLESGVPTDRALQTVREALQRRTRDAGMLDIPARVRRMVRDGVPPHEAIDRVRRLLRRNRAGVLGPALPVGDQPISDQKVRIYQRPPGG